MRALTNYARDVDACVLTLTGRKARGGKVDLLNFDKKKKRELFYLSIMSSYKNSDVLIL